MKALNKLLLLLLTSGVVIANCFYILDQRQTALVLQFGEVVSVKTEPGLKMRIPIVQQVIFFEKRIQHISFMSDDSSEVIALDQKTMKLDAFAKYRIVDPLKFYQAVQNEKALRARISAVIESTIREVVGGTTFADVLGAKRQEVMEKIAKAVQQQMAIFGLDVVDVRIARLGLPDKARKAVYGRMQTERLKESNDIRAHGAQENRKIKANAEREAKVIVAEALKEAEEIKGAGDAAASKIFATAYSEDPEFYSFYRTMQAYKEALGNNKTTLIISQTHPFLDEMAGK